MAYFMSPMTINSIGSAAVNAGKTSFWEEIQEKLSGLGKQKRRKVEIILTTRIKKKETF